MRDNYSCFSRIYKLLTIILFTSPHVGMAHPIIDSVGSDNRMESLYCIIPNIFTYERRRQLIAFCTTLSAQINADSQVLERFDPALIVDEPADDPVYVLTVTELERHNLVARFAGGITSEWLSPAPPTAMELRHVISDADMNARTLAPFACVLRVLIETIRSREIK